VNEFTRIAFDLLPPVARITLQNPPINVIDIPMMEQLSRAISLAKRAMFRLVLAGIHYFGRWDAGAPPDRVSEMLTKSMQYSARLSHPERCWWLAARALLQGRCRIRP
jgi:hypothetical protein